MATLVCFHAHPDDESIATGGTMARAAAEGHRVVLVVATRGEHGEPVPGVLDDDEHLWQRRVEETHRSAAILGAERVEFLGYVDSGMMGEPTNEHPGCFWQADIDDAAHRLLAVLRDVQADVLTVYDDHGGYGHPDHIQVHRVGVRAAELAGVSGLFASTMNRDQIARLIAEAGDDFDPGVDDERRDLEVEEFGSPESIITHAVDVAAHLDQKRRSMEAHASQIGADSFFLTLTPEQFAAAFGTEWYIDLRAGRAEGTPLRGDLFEGLA